MSIALTIIVLYLILTNFIGIWAARQVKSSPDFLIASGKFGTIFIVALLCGAWEGSGASIGITQKAFDTGLYAGFYSSFFTLGLFIAAFFIVPLARRLGVLTLPELVGKLFGNKGRWVTSVLWLMQDMIVLSMQFLGAAGIFSALFNIPVHWGIVITLLSVIFYMVLGGMISAGWTNLLHMIVMFVTALISIPLALNYKEGMSGAIATLPTEYFTVDGIGLGTLSGWFLAISSGPIIHQLTFSVANSAKTDKECRKGFFISALIICFYSLPFAILGVIAKAYLPETTGLLALPSLAMEINPYFGGFLLAGVMAAILSTLAPMLFASPTIFINDIYIPIRKNVSEKETLLVSRLCALVILCLGMLMALLIKSIVHATVFAFTFRLVVLVAVAIPLIFASMKKITIEGGISALVIGALSPIITALLANPIQPMYSAIIGVVIGIIFGSAFTQKKGNYVKEVWYFIKAHNDAKNLKGGEI